MVYVGCGFDISVVLAYSLLYSCMLAKLGSSTLLFLVNISVAFNICSFKLGDMMKTWRYRARKWSAGFCRYKFHVKTWSHANSFNHTSAETISSTDDNKKKYPWVILPSNGIDCSPSRLLGVTVDGMKLWFGYPYFDPFALGWMMLLSIENSDADLTIFLATNNCCPMVVVMFFLCYIGLDVLCTKWRTYTKIWVEA